MKKSNWSRAMIVVALVGALTLAGEPALANSGGGGSHTCAGGEITSGTYRSLTVTGACSVAANAVVTVTGDVLVARGASLDAQSAPATLTIRRNVTALPGSLLGLGCQPPEYTGNSAHACVVQPEGHSTITVGGGITALKASAVLLNGITVKGGVTLLGGGSPVPWSIKNNTIRGSVLISGQTLYWLGVMFNTVRGNVLLLKVHSNDPEPDSIGVYVVKNTVRKNLVCYGLTPSVSGGFVPGSVNVVGGRALGQCAPLV